MTNRWRTDLRHSLTVFFVTLIAMTALLRLPPIEYPNASTILAYASPVLLGLIAGLIGRGVAGLMAFNVAFALAHLAAIWLGFVRPPSEGETAARAIVVILFMALGSLGYVGGVLVRRAQARSSGAT